jgi:hypothetical protein
MATITMAVRATICPAHALPVKGVYCGATRHAIELRGAIYTHGIG